MQIDISEKEIAGGNLLESKAPKEPERVARENIVSEPEIKKGNGFINFRFSKE
jgi:hypothetical protein